MERPGRAPPARAPPLPPWIGSPRRSDAPRRRGGREVAGEHLERRGGGCRGGEPGGGGARHGGRGGGGETLLGGEGEKGGVGTAMIMVAAVK
jgi:hypothetical protein